MRNKKFNAISGNQLINFFNRGFFKAPTTIKLLKDKSVHVPISHFLIVKQCQELSSLPLPLDKILLQLI